MLYQLEQGKTEEWIAKQCRQGNMPLPDSIEKAPSILMGLELYMWAYTELDSCRPYTMGGPLCIPWTAVRDYAKANRFSRRQSSRLEVLCRKMDKAYLEWYGKKNGGDK